MSNMEVTMMALQKEREYLIRRAEKEACIAQVMGDLPVGVRNAASAGLLRRGWRAVTGIVRGRWQRPLPRPSQCEPRATAAD